MTGGAPFRLLLPAVDCAGNLPLAPGAGRSRRARTGRGLDRPAAFPSSGTPFSSGDGARRERARLPSAEAIVIAEEAAEKPAAPDEPEAEDPSALARGADRAAAPRGRRRAADRKGRVLPRGEAARDADQAALLGRDRPRRRAAPADGARRRLRRHGPRHRRGRLRHQPGQGPPRRAPPAAPRSRRRARSASRWRSSRSAAGSPSRSSSSSTRRRSLPGPRLPTRRPSRWRSGRAATSCARPRSPTTGRRPTTSGC